MAVRTLLQLKAWFKTGFHPVQSQFYDWMDSYFHKDETIPVDKIEGLDELINNMPTQESIDAVMGQLLPIILTAPNYQFTIPAGQTVYLIRCDALTDHVITISDGVTGDVIAQDVEVFANVTNAITIPFGAPTNESRICYVAGMGADNISLRIFKI